eukprot:5531785-Amphidinium_carterae.1
MQKTKKVLWYWQGLCLKKNITPLRWQDCLSDFIGRLPLVEPVEIPEELLGDVQTLLDLPLPRSRLEKLDDGSRSPNRSALLGAFTRQGVGVCRHTSQQKYLGLLQASHRLARLRQETLVPYTSISVNEGAYAPHVDQNWGPTVVFAAGQYKGGELHLLGDDEAGAIKAGRKIVGHHAFVMFDATQRHEVLPYLGVRRSLSFFTVRGPEKLTAAHWTSLQRWGFPVTECISLLGLQVPALLTSSTSSATPKSVLSSGPSTAVRPSSKSVRSARSTSTPRTSKSVCPPSTSLASGSSPMSVCLPSSTLKGAEVTGAHGCLAQSACSGASLTHAHQALCAAGADVRARAVVARKRKRRRNVVRTVAPSQCLPVSGGDANFESEMAYTFVGVHEDLILPCLSPHLPGRSPLGVFMNKGRELLQGYLLSCAEESGEVHFPAACADLLPCGLPFKRNPITLGLPLEFRGVHKDRRLRRLKVLKRQAWINQMIAQLSLLDVHGPASRRSAS